MSPIIASTLTIILLVIATAESKDFLRVEGSNLMLGGEEVFLSGANLPWVNYGNDFGNAQPNGVACTLQASEQTMPQVSYRGGKISLYVVARKMQAS